METSNNSERQLHAMALVATLRTAAEVCHSMALRRGGADPSDQQDESTARRSIREALVELGDAVRRLRLSQIVDRPDEAALVMAFEDRMLLARAARDLHVMHLHLLSLYPAVEEELVEIVRRLQAEAARLAVADSGGFEEAAEAWAGAADACAWRLLRAL